MKPPSNETIKKNIEVVFALRDYCNNNLGGNFDSFADQIMPVVSLSKNQLTEWFYKSQYPGQISLIKAGLFLYQKGIVLSFLKDIDPLLLELGFVLLEKNIGFRDASRMLKLGPNSLTRNLIGIHPMKGTTLKKLKSFIQSLQKFGNNGNESPTHTVSLTRKQEKSKGVSRLGASFHNTELLVGLLQLIIPHLEQFAMASTEEEREQFRHLVGANEMFRLSNITAALCSETAHRNYRNSNNRNGEKQK